MRKDEKEAIATAVVELMTSYDRQVGEFVIDIWLAALERFDFDIALNALGAYLADPERCKYPPKPGDIVGMIEGTKSDRSIMGLSCWRKAIDAIDSEGRYKSVVFDDPAIHYAIKIVFGSWERFCNADDLKYRQGDFVKAYASFTRGTPYPGTLTGAHERENTAAGYDYDRITYVGDVKRCKAVSDSGNGSQRATIVHVNMKKIANA